MLSLRPRRNSTIPDWNRSPDAALDRAILRLSAAGDALHWRDLLAGGAILLGEPGSGKTSIMRVLASACMRQGTSVVCFTVKPDDAVQYEAIARMCGRDVTIYRPLETAFNPLLELQRRGQGQLGTHEKLLAMVMDCARRLHEGSSGDAAFWMSLASNSVSHVLLIAMLAGTPLSFRWILDCMHSLPRSPEEAADEAWQATCPACAAIALARRKPLTAAQRADLDRAARWLLVETPRTPAKTLASIEATLVGTLTQLARGEIGHVLNAEEASWSPASVVERPGILILDCSVQEFGPLGSCIQRLIKSTLFDILKSRNLRAAGHPVVLLMDEWQDLLDARTDPDLMRTLRDRRASLIGATQCVSNLISACADVRDPHAAASALLGLAGTRIFCSTSDPETLRFMEQAATSTPQARVSFGVNDRKRLGSGEEKGGRSDRSSNLAFDLQPSLPAYQVARLRRGGTENNGIVEAYVMSCGRIFKASGKSTLKVAFKQLRINPRPRPADGTPSHPLTGAIP